MRIIKNTLGPFLENSYLIIERDMAFVVDPGFYFNEVLKKHPEIQIKGVLLTHGHIDHIFSIGLFECPIYIHKDEYQCLENGDLSLYNMYDSKLNYDLKKLDIRLVSDQDEIKFNDHIFKVILTRGHTKGSLCYNLDNNYLFTGDTLFKGSVGRCDLPTGDEKELSKSLMKLKKMSKSLVILPGHEDNSTLKYELDYNPYLKQ